MRIHIFGIRIRFGWHERRNGRAVTNLFEIHEAEWKQAEWWYKNRHQWDSYSWNQCVAKLGLIRKVDRITVTDM